jgi:hypothetical protein
MDPSTIAIIAIVIAAASELIALSPLKENSVIQVIIDLLLTVFPRGKK